MLCATRLEFVTELTNKSETEINVKFCVELSVTGWLASRFLTRANRKCRHGQVNSVDQ